MTATIFYSWQNDCPRGVCRDIIGASLRASVKRLSVDLTEALRVDSDTQGVSGTPSIAATIFSKVDTAAVFVADVTLVGKVHPPSEKSLTNPNVMIELGYAAARLGWDRIILVMNDWFGGPELLPFDLRNHRFPVPFSLSPDAGGAERKSARKQLARRLEEYIGAALGFQLAAAEQALAALDHYALELLLKHDDDTPWGVNMTFGSHAQATPFDLAVSRLLQLGLAATSIGAQHGLAHYTWTYRGRQVQRILVERGLRSRSR